MAYTTGLRYYQAMRTRSQSASIRQLLAMVYLVITVPACVFMAMIASAIDHRIEQAQQTEVDGDKFALATNPRSTWLINVGRALRETGAPFSTSPDFNENGRLNREIALSLSDVRTALIYLWGLIFVIGAGVIWALGVRLNQPLTDLTESIDKLAKGELMDPITILGPSNIIEMGNGLEKLRQRLRESESQQLQFLRHISHEIKTPLTSIKEGSKLLEDELLGPINEEQREVTEILNKSTGELQRSIENLLNYNSAISIKNIKRRQKVDLSELAIKALDKHALQIKHKEIDLQTEFSTSRAFVDPEQIQTVFENLISNAIKYSPQNGSISVIVRTIMTRQSEFLIQDEGPGISPSQQEAIFDAFFVGDQAVQTTLKGTGLGLSIVKQYIEAHEGTINILKTRKGAAFQVLLG